jgi:hypothetical protein
MKISKKHFSINKNHFLVLALASLIGFYLRIEPVLFDASHFGYDQGIDISYVRRLVVDHKLSLIGRFTGLEGIFMGPLWTWILTIPYILSGGNPSANVVFLSLLGITAVWYTYIIVRKMLSEAVALLSALFVAVSHPFISSAHNVISPSPLAVLMIFYIWFLWEVINGNKKYWPWLGLFLGIFFQFEIGFAIFLLPATAAAYFLLGEKKLKLSKNLFFGIGVFLSTFLPQVLFEFRHQFLMTKSLVKFLSGENLSLGSQKMNFVQRIGIRSGSLQEDLVYSVSLIQNNSLVVLSMILAAIFGFVVLVKIKNKKIIKFISMLLILIATIYLGFAIYPGPVWSWYRAGLPITFILLLTIGWSQVIPGKRVLNGVVVIFFFMALIGAKPRSHLDNYLSGYQGGASSLKNQKNALDTIYKEAPEKFDLYVYTPPVYTYVWDHILSWYAQPKYAKQPQEYGFKRSKTSTNDFYLLIEPDDLSIRIDGWKGGFVEFGKPVKNWKLPGDITIEKWKASEDMNP